MKKAKTKLNLGKSIIVSLEKEAQRMLIGGRVQSATESQGGHQCVPDTADMSCQTYAKCCPS